MSVTSTSITGMKNSQSIISQTADNIANASTPGFKSNFSNLANIKDNNGVYAVTGNNMDLKGSLEATNIKGDLALDGSKGYFIAKERGDGGRVVNLVTGSFKPNKAGYLEYLDKYLLLGARYNDDGSLPAFNTSATLEPIYIDYNIISKAKASTQITENFNLNSSLLAKGKGSFVISPTDANRSTNKNLDGYLVEGGDLISNNSFAITIQEERNGEIISKTTNCIFIGAKPSTAYTSTNTDLTFAAGDTLDITINGITRTILDTDITGTTNADKLSDLSNKLIGLGVRTSIKTDSVAGTSTLVILPPVNSEDSLKIAGNIANSLGITYSVEPTKSSYKRFSTMNEIKQILEGDFDQIDSNISSDSLIIIAKSDTNISFRNNSGNLLKALGLDEGVLKGQGYDPYGINMASGQIRPDFLKSVTLYDAKGNSHLATFALKKVEDGWIQELYFSNVNSLDSNYHRNDGLVQVTKFTFDREGKINGQAAVVPTVTANNGLVNPFATLTATSGTGTILVAGTSFTLNNAGGANDFTSLAELAAKINTNPATSNLVKATLIKDANVFKLKIVSKNGMTPTVTTSNLPFAMNSANFNILPAADQTLTIYFKPEENLDNLDLTFDTNSIKESSYKEMNGIIDSDGNAPAAVSDYTIDKDGVLSLTFTDGTQKAYYKIPVAIFRNQNGLEKLGNNAYSATSKSGEMQIVDLGTGGSGSLLSGVLEMSNVDEAEQLAKLVQNKQSYNMNTKSWQTGNELLTYLLSAAS
jgi:flagellar hook-basal body protein